MKSFLIFLAGLITGVGLIIGFAFLYDASNDGMTMFEQPGECVSTDTFGVIQVLDGGALAMEYTFALPTGLIVFLLDQNGQSYYDSQLIEIPKGQCARQVGIYKYTSKEGDAKTVPVVEILE